MHYHRGGERRNAFLLFCFCCEVTTMGHLPGDQSVTAPKATILISLTAAHLDVMLLCGNIQPDNMLCIGYDLLLWNLNNLTIKLLCLMQCICQMKVKYLLQFLFHANFCLLICFYIYIVNENFAKVL